MDWLYGRREGMRRRMLAWPLALLIVAVLHAVGVYFVLQLQINNAPEVYYKADAPAVLLRDELRREFPSDEVLTVLFQGEDLYEREFLERLGRLDDILSENPRVDRVSSVVSMERISGSSDGFAVERLVDLDLRQDWKADAVRQRVLGDRFAPGGLASEDGTALALVVRPKPVGESAERLALKVEVARAINEVGLARYYAGDAGPVTVDVAQLTAVLEDSRVFVPATVVVGLLLLGWVVGRVKPVVIGAVAMSTVVLPMVAAVSASGQPYTMATAILPTLLAAYTLATLLHFYAAVQKAQVSALDRGACVDQALDQTLRPGAYNVLTTGAGLLSLVLVPIPPIQVFGLAGALGTLLVFLTVFYLVPPILVSWDRRPWPRRGSGMNKLGRLASRMTISSMRRPKMSVALAVVLLVAAFPLAKRVQVESDVLAFFKPEHPLSRHTQAIESKLSGVTSLELSLVGAERDAFQDVVRLAAVRDLQRWLDDLPEVDRSLSAVDLIEEMHWAMNGEKAAFRTLPGNDRLLRQYLLVYDGTDLYELVNRDFQHARILLSLNVHGSNDIAASIAKIREHLAAKPIPGVKVDIGGHGRLFADQVDLLVTGQINSFAGAFTQIFLFMALLWRSFSASALCLVPNLAPLYFIFVLMGATGIHLDLATVMIAGVVLGITVDDTIHLYHGYRERLQRGVSPVLAIARSFQSSGRAVLAISVVLVAQFGLMTTSDFLPTSNFGLMTAVGLLAGQLAELLLLPALLALKDGGRGLMAKRGVTGVPLAARIRSAPSGKSRSESSGDAASWQASSTGVGSHWEPTRLLPRAPELEGERIVLVCHGPDCRRAGSDKIYRRLARDRVDLPGQTVHVGWRIVRTGCLGPCNRAPVVRLVSGSTDFPTGSAAQTIQLVRTRIASDIADANQL